MAADFPPPAVGISRGWGWGPLLPRTHLHKQGDGVEPEDLHAVHGIPGQDVQGPSAALHDLLHPHTVLHQKRQWGMVTGGPWTWPHTHTLPTTLRQPHWSVKWTCFGCSLLPHMCSCVHTHSRRGHPDPRHPDPGEGGHRHRQLTDRVGLLCACRHVALGILVGLDQQLDEAGNDCCLLQWGMVGWAQSQIPDQADGCLARQQSGEFLGCLENPWFPSIVSSSLSPRPDTDILEDLQRMRPPQLMSLIPTGPVGSHV